MAIGARSCPSMFDRPPGVVERRSRPCRCAVAGRARGREPGSLMARICRVPVFSRVTGITVGRGIGICAVKVAQIALHARVSTRQRKRRCAVIEHRAYKARRGVAESAILREPGNLMVRTSHAVVVRQMAGNAG